MTARTIQGRYLLRPSTLANALIAGVLSLARERYDVRIFNVVVLSNHFHLIVAAASPRELSAFMCFVMTNIAREIGRLHDWRGPFWDRRHRTIPITDEASLLSRMRYVFENGCKEGLVSHPALWPGLNAVNALMKGTPLEGVWVDRTAMYQARKSTKDVVREEDHTSHRMLMLDVLPLWDGLSLEEQQKKVAELVAEAAQAAPSTTGKKSERAILTQQPHHRPATVKSSRAPLCHASDQAERSKFRDAYAAFMEAYRAAADKLRSGLSGLGFPTHAQVMAFAVLEAS